MDKELDRCIGALVGLAVGDALGTTNEFCHPEECTILSDSYVGKGPFDLSPGQWTDDTAMALCLANSLVECGFNPSDQLKKYGDWYCYGYNSCTGDCFDIGGITVSSLKHFNETGDTISPLNGTSHSGNGGIMRLAPVVLYYKDNLLACINSAKVQSMTTHSSTLCTEAAGLMAELMFRAIKGEQKESWCHRHSRTQTFTTPEITEIDNGEYIYSSKNQVWKQNGFVASTLAFALWCFYHTNSFIDCVMLAANAGGDADTNAAVAGQIAGAYYGYSSIPKQLLDNLAWHDEIVHLGKTLSLRVK